MRERVSSWIKLCAPLLGGIMDHDGSALVHDEISILNGGDVVLGIHGEKLCRSGVALEWDGLNLSVGHPKDIQSEVDIPGKYE